MSKSNVNVHPIDLFTICHLSWGIWLGQWFTPMQTMGIMTAFEFTENWQKHHIPQLSPHPSFDKPINSVFDVLAAGLGAVLVRRGMRKAKLPNKDIFK